MKFLKDHPFGVEAFFKSSLVLTYAVPKPVLQALIPECLSLDTFNDEWAFVAAAFVQTKHLRPKGFPAFMGNDFFLTGFRIFVRYTDSRGKRLRGLYILKSETDKTKMSILGNIFTHYNYTRTDIDLQINGDHMAITSLQSDIQVMVELNQEDVPLPAGSPFKDWKEARRFAGPLPFTFTYDKIRKEVLMIEGVRENWTPKPVKVLSDHIGFVQSFTDRRLANAFIIENIPYHWKKGVIDKWHH